MKRFEFYFIIAGRSEETGKARIYATPVYNAAEYIHFAEIYKTTQIKSGAGWEMLHLAIWAEGPVKMGMYLIHKGRGLVLRLSGDTPYLRAQELRSLAGYAESEYLKNI